MATRETLLRIGSLQGTASNVLLLMLALGRPTGRNELALLTGRSKHTIRNALARLEFLGLAQNHSRYNGWVLTAYATQGFLADSGSAKSAEPAGRAQPELPSWSDDRSSPELPTHAKQRLRRRVPEVQKTPLASSAAPPEVHNVHLASFQSIGEVPNLHLDTARPSREVQNLHLPSSSSCSLDQDTKSTPSQEKPQLQPPEPVDPPPRASPAVRERRSTSGPEVPGLRRRRSSSPELQAAIDLLAATGCPARTSAGRGAVDAVEAALAAGWTAAEVCRRAIPVTAPRAPATPRAGPQGPPASRR